jgi:hypothetical protein
MNRKSKSFKHLLVAGFLSLAFLSGCSKDSDPCSSASNVDSPECQKDIPDIDDRPLTLAINFRDSFYYDTNTQTWMTVKKENLDGGIFGQTVNIYSTFLNISTDAALAKISIAADQKARPSVYPISEYDRIPYIEVEYESGVDYIYNYVKRDLNNNIIYEKTGSMVIYQNRALLPLINAMFDNQFYTSAGQISSRFIHSLAIAAQSKNKRGTKTANIEFETVLQIPNTDFYVEYATDSTFKAFNPSNLSASGFSLPTRWNYYFGGNDNVPNSQMKFFTLKEIKDISEQIPLDVRVVFQEPPKLTMTQEQFFEMPLDLDAFKATGKVTPQRGYAFYTQTNSLDSDKDFKMKIRMNGQFVTLSSQREFEVTGLAAGTPWDMEFYYDFSQNALYNSGDGKGLLTPLKPACVELTNGVFNPIQESLDRQTALNNGGFIAICHPADNTKVVIPADQLATTNKELSDTWYDFFSYYPYDQYKNELGHFFGLRRVSFKAEGCVRVYVRQQGNSNWDLKSQGNANCDPENTGTTTTNNGWVYFYAERQFTVFDYINNYDGVAGLKSLIQFFGSKPVRQTPYFYFNNDLNNSKHIY